MNKHTRGPWIKALARSTNDAHDLKGRKYFTGFIYGNERDDFNNYSPVVCGDITEEDANLIAAAPELLEAARSAAAILRGSGFTENTKALIELQAAIDKAEGQDR